MLASVEEVFREAAARWVLVAYFALSTVFVLIFAAAVNLDVVDGALAGVRLFGKELHGGAIGVDLDKLVLGFESGFAAVLYLVGTFLAIFSTAHLVPRLQEKGTVDLYLSRPVGRVPLLLSRYVGGLLLAAANVYYLMGAIWVVVGVKTGVWNPRFLTGGTVILFTIAILLGFAFLVGAATSSTAVSIMCTYAVFFASSVLAAHEKIEAALSSEWSVSLVKGLYWTLPKTAALGQSVVLLASDGMTFARRQPFPDPLVTFGTSALFGALCLAAAAGIFSRKDF
jgi:ABC-type transport system involved in multi-copper enzyme maturation permease subunit